MRLRPALRILNTLARLISANRDGLFGPFFLLRAATSKERRCDCGCYDEMFGRASHKGL
jgi:hypothetical protein